MVRGLGVQALNSRPSCLPYAVFPANHRTLKHGKGARRSAPSAGSCHEAIQTYSWRNHSPQYQGFSSNWPTPLWERQVLGHIAWRGSSCEHRQSSIRTPLDAQPHKAMQGHLAPLSQPHKPPAEAAVPWTSCTALPRAAPAPPSPSRSIFITVRRLWQPRL